MRLTFSAFYWRPDRPPQRSGPWNHDPMCKDCRQTQYLFPSCACKDPISWLPYLVLYPLTQIIPNVFELNPTSQITQCFSNQCSLLPPWPVLLLLDLTLRLERLSGGTPTMHRCVIASQKQSINISMLTLLVQVHRQRHVKSLRELYISS